MFSDATSGTPATSDAFFWATSTGSTRPLSSLDHGTRIEYHPTKESAEVPQRPQSRHGSRPSSAKRRPWSAADQKMAATEKEETTTTVNLSDDEYGEADMITSARTFMVEEDLEGLGIMEGDRIKRDDHAREFAPRKTKGTRFRERDERGRVDGSFAHAQRVAWDEIDKQYHRRSGKVEESVKEFVDSGSIGGRKKSLIEEFSELFGSGLPHRGSSASRQKKERTKKYRIDEQIPIEETGRSDTSDRTEHYEVEEMDPEFPLPDRPVTVSSSDGVPTDVEREDAESGGRKDPILNESSDSSAPTSPLIIPSQKTSEIPDKRRREYYSLYVAINHDRSLHDWRFDVLVTDLTNSSFSPYAFRDVRVNSHNEIIFQSPDVSVMNPIDFGWVDEPEELFGHTLRVMVYAVYPRELCVVDSKVTFGRSTPLVCEKTVAHSRRRSMDMTAQQYTRSDPMISARSRKRGSSDRPDSARVAERVSAIGGELGKAFERPPSRQLPPPKALDLEELRIQSEGFRSSGRSEEKVAPASGKRVSKKGEDEREQQSRKKLHSRGGMFLSQDEELLPGEALTKETLMTDTEKIKKKGTSKRRRVRPSTSSISSLSARSGSRAREDGLETYSSAGWRDFARQRLSAAHVIVSQRSSNPPLEKTPGKVRRVGKYVQASYPASTKPPSRKLFSAGGLSPVGLQSSPQGGSPISSRPPLGSPPSLRTRTALSARPRKKGIPIRSMTHNFMLGPKEGDGESPFH